MKDRTPLHSTRIRTLAAISIAALALAVSACGDGDDDSNSAGAAATTEAPATTTATTEAPETTEACTDGQRREGDYVDMVCDDGRWEQDAESSTTIAPTTTAVQASRDTLVAVQRCVDAIGNPDILALAAANGLEENIDEAQAACDEAFTQAQVDSLPDAPFLQINASLSGLAVEASFAALGTEVELDSPIIVDAVDGLKVAVSVLERDVLG